MADDKKKGNLTSSDSGYASLSGHSRNSSRVLSDEFADPIFKGKTRTFTDFISNIGDLRKTSVQQTDILNDYLRYNVSEQNPDAIKEERYFSLLDHVLERVLKLPSKERVARGALIPVETKLTSNEGSAFLSIVQVCSNKDVILRVLNIIGTEKNKSKQELLKKYVDKDGRNTLHLLADLIVKRYECQSLVMEDDSAAFLYLSECMKELAQQKDDDGRIPEEIITERTELAIGDEMYKFRLGEANLPQFFKTL